MTRRKMIGGDELKKAITDGTLAGFISEGYGISGLETEYIDGEKIAAY